MRSIKQILVLSLISIITFSCTEGKMDSEKGTWIGGAIINPKMDYVVISKDQKVIDTVLLDKNNFFTYKFKDFSPGIYSFSHYEYQVLYLEPTDSIMLRVNTLEFDESLAFSGKGADKNNLLIEMFLINEKENKLVSGWYNLDPEDYEAKLDSMKQVRMNIYENFIAKHKVSEDFKEIAKANVYYDYGIKKEWYISANNYQREEGDTINIPSSFYSYREQINYGNEDLRSYYPYYRFLSYHLDNLAYQEYKNEESFNRYSYLHNLNKTQLINNLVTCESLKNHMMANNVRRFLLNGKSEENQMDLLNRYLSLSTNEEYKKELQELAATTINLTAKHEIPNVMLLTSENTVQDLHSIIRKPTVLYFWTTQSIQHYKNTHLRANELREKYPEYEFIGINTDTHFKKWLKVVKNSDYDVSSEYQFDDIEEAKQKLLINSINKAIILDKKGTIMESNTNLFSPYIEEQLLGAINKKGSTL